MDDYKINCNCCGKEFVKTESIDSHMDYMHIQKPWGYFSSKDLSMHSFNICEKCYDEWVANFVIPIEDSCIQDRYIENNYIEDIFPYTEEEITLLSEAYQIELSK